MPTAIQATRDDLTREVFGNVPAAGQAVFYALAALAVVALAYGVYRRVRRWRRGVPGDVKRRRPALRQLIADAVWLRRVSGRGWADVAHGLVLIGFVVLLIGTTLVALEHVAATVLGRSATQPVFHRGIYYAVFEVVTDAAGLALLAGGVLFLLRRARRPASLSPDPRAWWTLGGLLLIGVTGYALEALRILREQPAQPGWSFVGAGLADGLAPLVRNADVPRLHLGVWWLHAVLVLSWIAALPFTRLLHLLVGSGNLAWVGRAPLNTLRLVPLEEVARAGRVGVGEVSDFSRQQLVQLDACVACGRCEAACPAYEAGKPLSPKQLVQALRQQLDATGRASSALHGATVQASTVWSCTACAACVDVCPLGVRPFDLLVDLRRYLVGDGQLRGSPASALQKLQRAGNPWGMSSQDRLAWAAGLDVPTARDHPDFEVLYWVGCAAAYDPRLHKVARSVVHLLQRASVNFAVLGSEERCTGEAARRLGDEFLFQELATANIATFRRYRVNRILTHCPHCWHTFRHDYPQLGGHYEVLHHTQFLAALVRSGRLPGGSASLRSGRAVTYHDPCYLARAGGVIEPPRMLLTSGGDESRLVEMARRGRFTSCCGGGGGRLWFDDPPAERTGTTRAREAVATGAEVIGVACPFCLQMLTDATADAERQVAVRDVAELLAEENPVPRDEPP
jgi:Fe-S oxidoreductase